MSPVHSPAGSVAAARVGAQLASATSANTHSSLETYVDVICIPDREEVRELVPPDAGLQLYAMYPPHTSILDRDTLGAFCRHTHVSLDGAPDGPLAGLTFGLKDIYDIAGYHTGFGSPDWLATHDVARTTASVAARLLDAGATLVGRTHTEEMAFSLTGENAHYGTPVNVAAPGRVPGGSSSGSAAAVAGGLVDFAIGSDTGGSVRAPASFCGIYGIRPTKARIPLDGVLPLARRFDTCGWFARDADMLARVGEVLLGGNAPVPGRLLFATDAFALATPEAAAALAPAVQRVERLLGRAVPLAVSKDGLRAWFEAFRTLQAGDIWREHGEWVTRTQPTFGPQIRARFAAIAQTREADVLAAKQLQADVTAQLYRMLDGDAVLLLPSMPDIAPLLHASPEDTVAFRERALSMLCIAGLGGLPQVSLPYATLQGAPIGLSMIAGRGNDEMLLALARRLERETESA